MALFFSACQKAGFTTEKEASVGLNECWQEATGKETVSIYFDSLLQDSRCPIDANCVWQGVALVRLKLTLNRQLHTIELATRNKPPFRTDTVLHQYRFSLLEVKPYPGGTTHEQPSVVVRIEH